MRTKTMTMTRSMLLILCCIYAVGCQSSAEGIGGKVQLLLQQKIDTAFGSRNVKITSVVAIREAGNKYQGVANIAAFGAPMTLKLAILADRSNVIYETTAVDWANFVTYVNQQKTKAVEGQYSDVAITNETVFSCFPDLLRRDKVKFVERLATVGPVKLETTFWFGSGCKAHECVSEEAAWALDRDNAKGYAIILTNGLDRPTFSIYGCEPEDLPPPLLSWALEHGMAEDNSVVIRPEKKGNN